MNTKKGKGYFYLRGQRDRTENNVHTAALLLNKIRKSELPAWCKYAYVDGWYNSSYHAN